MKTSPNLDQLPARRPLVTQPRQLCIAFETQVLRGMTPEQRAAGVQALVALVMQAAGIHEPEADDAQQ